MDLKEFIEDQIRDLETLKQSPNFSEKQKEELDAEIQTLKERIKLYE